MMPAEGKLRAEIDADRAQRPLRSHSPPRSALDFFDIAVWRPYGGRSIWLPNLPMGASPDGLPFVQSMLDIEDTS
jgi:hypothetical protein